MTHQKKINLLIVLVRQPENGYFDGIPPTLKGPFGQTLGKSRHPQAVPAMANLAYPNMIWL